MPDVDIDAPKDEIGPKALLAIDGGGIRGVLSLEILAEIERQLAEITGAGREFRLCQFFDYVAGTSTGAIIAAGIARNMTVRELRGFYVRHGREIFKKRWLGKRLWSLYGKEALSAELQRRFGTSTLHPGELETLLMIVTYNGKTDSPWPVSSNPRAKYNLIERDDCNLALPLWKLVRASTAAPVYFPAEVIELGKKKPKRFTFEDGGITPYNNPAFLLYRMATTAPYHLDWPTGERRLMLVSVGSGSAPEVTNGLPVTRSLFSNARRVPKALMYGMQNDQDICCRSIGRCVYGAPLDRELGDMIPRQGENPRDGAVVPLDQDLGRAFLYARYDAKLDEEGLGDLGLGHIPPKEVQPLDAVGAMPELQQIGRAVARNVDLGRQFKPFLETWRRGRQET